jgi:DNA polymerase elongation subunit (family B)
MKFYTNFSRYGNQILVRGYNNGKRHIDKINYDPTLYIPSKEKTEFKTMSGEFVSPVRQGSMSNATEFIKRYEDVDNYSIYGLTNYQYVYANEVYPGKVDYDISLIRIANIDIEVGSENGFPEPASASEPITAITFKIDGMFYVFGCDEFNNDRNDVTYTQCRDENQLIMFFLEKWEETSPDIVTGWNIKYFDIPYLVSRINRLMGENTAKRLSPWRRVNEKNSTYSKQDGISWKSFVNYELVGISTLDYLELYKKFTYAQHESFSLNHISFVELGEKKLDYSEVESLHQLYRTNFQKFIEYNIRDVELVDRIDAKMKLIDMALALAYDAKVNYEDVFSQVRMWDVLIHNELIDRGVVVPQKVKTIKSEQYAGAYVKDPIVGMHEWVVSFDLNSLYPHLIMQYNISPETIVPGIKANISIDDLLNKEYQASSEYCMAANGHYFKRDKQGFLPAMMQRMYDDRSMYKKKMIESQKQYENANTAEEKRILSNQISKYKNLQLAKKVQLNSAYGALGNEWFRFFDIRQAEAITLSGQLSIRWIEDKLNGFFNKLLKTKSVDYVIASDTDSVYVNLGPLVHMVYGSKNIEKEKIVDFIDKACTEKIEPFIDKAYQELADYMNAFDQKMQMKREVIANKGIWTAKKRYILNVYDSEGVRFAEPKLKMMGIEAVKSSTPMSCRDKIKDSLKIVMNGTELEFQEFVADFRKTFTTLAFEDIAFPRGVNDIKKYKSSKDIYTKGTPIHVRGAILYNHLLEKEKLTKKYQSIKDGEKIKFCYMKVPNPVQENVFAILTILPKEFKLEKYIDYETQFEKAYLDPIRTIVNTIGWNVEKVSSLKSFFSDD